MVRFYRLKYNLPTFWQGDIAMLGEDGNLWFVGNENPELREQEQKLHWRGSFIMYNSKTLANFNILATYFDELSEEEVMKIWPVNGCKYWFISDKGVEWTFWKGDEYDLARKKMGNCFLTLTDAKKAQDKVWAICRLNLLGMKMDSFSSGKDGHAYLTLTFPPEAKDEVCEALMDLIGAVNENI